jgi:uncharacterized protein YtpQ (UPF0354 family)
MVVPPIVQPLVLKSMKYQGLISFALLAVASLLSGGCTQSPSDSPDTTGKIQNRENIKSTDQPPGPVAEDAVPGPKVLPSNIFAEELESPQLKPEDFTKHYMHAVQSALPSTNVTSEKPLLVFIKMRVGHREATKIDLTKMWLKCKDEPGKRRATIQPSIEAIYNMTNFVDQPLEGEEFIDKIVPLVRNEKFVQSTLTARTKNEKRDAYYDKLFHGLYVVYGVEDPSGIKLLDTYYVTSRAQIDPKTLRSRAVQNLERIVKNKVEIKAEGPIFRVKTESNYEPSLIISDKLARELQAAVKGRLVVSIPNNAEMFICGDETPGALQKLKETTAEAGNRGALPISQSLYVRDQGSWKIFTAFDSQ